MKIVYNHEDIVAILQDIRKQQHSYVCGSTDCPRSNGNLLISCCECCLDFVTRQFNDCEYEWIENYLQHIKEKIND